MDIQIYVKEYSELTPEQKEILEALQEVKYNISISKLANKLNRNYSSVYNDIKIMDKKGYAISKKIFYTVRESDNLEEIREKRKQNELDEKQKRQQEEKLTPEQEELLAICKEHDYDISIFKLANKLGKTSSTIQREINKMHKKGYNIFEKMEQKKEEKRQSEQEERRKKIEEGKQRKRQRQKEIQKRSLIQREEELTQNQKKLIDILEKYDYCISNEKLKEVTGMNSQANHINFVNIITKFSKLTLNENDKYRVAKFIKNREGLEILLKKVSTNNRISYDNIKVLIDELLQYVDEDKTNGIRFVIDYVRILLEKGMERVEEPLYQLLVKHKVQLNKSQCLRVEELMNIYEQIIKEDQKILLEVEEDKNSQGQVIEIE